MFNTPLAELCATCHLQHLPGYNPAFGVLIQTSIAGERNSFTSRRHCSRPSPHRRIWTAGQSTTKVIANAQKVPAEVKKGRQLDFTHDTHALAGATSKSSSSQSSHPQPTVRAEQRWHLHLFTPFPPERSSWPPVLKECPARRWRCVQYA